MENDSIRASGTDTLVDLWVEGKLRAICLTRGAIEAFTGFDGTSAASEASRCEFVRTHLLQVIAAAKSRLSEGGNPGANEILIDAGHLGGADDRRSDERRKGERRKLKIASNKLPKGERRRSDRRAGNRRRSTRKTSD